MAYYTIDKCWWKLFLYRPYLLHNLQYLHFYRLSYIIDPMEFAVIKTGGKQYKVSLGSVLSVEKIKGE